MKASFRVFGFFRWALVLALLAALGYLLWPKLQQAERYRRLVALPAPTALAHPLPNRPFTDTWGAARSGGRKHEGTDIFAPRNTPILSTTQGIVWHQGSNTLGGLTVTILGPAAQRHYYAHLERYADLSTGQWIEAGTVIGYVGDSGNAKGTPPHLHYGIYQQGGAINPYPLLKKGLAEASRQKEE